MSSNAARPDGPLESDLVIHQASFEPPFEFVVGAVGASAGVTCQRRIEATRLAIATAKAGGVDVWFRERDGSFTSVRRFRTRRPAA